MSHQRSCHSPLHDPSTSERLSHYNVNWHVLDSEAPKDLKTAIQANSCIELPPPDLHWCKNAKWASQVFKGHFIPILSGAADNSLLTSESHLFPRPYSPWTFSLNPMLPPTHPYKSFIIVLLNTTPCHLPVMAMRSNFMPNKDADTHVMSTLLVAGILVPSHHTTTLTLVLLKKLTAQLIWHCLL